MRAPGALAVAGAALLAASVSASAQEQIGQKELAELGFFQDFDELDLETLLEAEEVATRLASGRDEGTDRAPGVVSILTGDELRDLGARTLGEALVLLPGVDVQRDQLGRARVLLRGVVAATPATSSAGLLVLFNGQRLNEPIAGGSTAVNLEMSVEDVERIELLRGPASALYGDGALAGVLAITTRLGESESAIELSSGVGSFGTQRHYVRVGSVSGDLKLSGYVYIVDSSGPELEIPEDTQTARDAALAPAGIAPVSLAPGLANTELTAVETSYRVAFRDLELNLRYKREVAGNFVGFNDALGERGDLDNKQFLLDLAWRRDLLGGGLEARGSWAQSERVEIQSAAPPDFTLPLEEPVRFPAGVVYQGEMRARRYGVEAAWDRELGFEHRLRAGVSLHRETSFDPAAFGNLDFRTLEPLPEFQPLEGVVSEQARGVLGLWAQETWTRDPVTVTAGLRLDHYGGGTGSQLSPRLGVVWELPSGLFLKGLYARGFRAPTLSELHFDLPGLFANPALDPVRMDSLEVAAWRRFGDLRVSANAFLGFLRDPITTAAPGSPFDPQEIVNGPDVDTRGLEVDLLREFGLANSVFANYTLQAAEESRSGQRAAGIPTHLANLGGSFALGRYVVVTPSLSLRSALPRAPGDPRPDVDGYALLDATVRLRRFFRTLEISATVRNLFDETWLDPAPVTGLPGDYPRPGRSVFVHATYTF